MTTNKYKTPLISIVIPVYNRPETLKATLLSVINQTYSEIEIIVIDDGSETEIYPIIEELKDSRIVYFRLNHANANVARNFGMKNSHGDFIAMLDSDDLWLENHLESCLNLLIKEQADGLYGSLFLRNAITNHKQKVVARPLMKNETMIDYLLSTGCGAQTSTLFMTKESAISILWDGNLNRHQDYDFVIRYSKRYKLIAKTDPTVLFTTGQNKQKTINFESCIKVINDNKADISPMIYYNYSLNMLRDALSHGASDKVVEHYKKETTFYRKFIHIKKMNPTLSFCITCRNRAHQIKQTLAKNLKDNEKLKNCIEFILVDFGSTDGLQEWIITNFEKELDEGYLKYYYTDELKKWHSSIAKNTAHNLANNDIVVNLDCDNFTGTDGGLFVINKMKEYGGNVIIHQFSNNWGDGSYGRIALTKSRFLEIGGYNEDFEPFGYQDVDLILRLWISGSLYMHFADKEYNQAIVNEKKESSDVFEKSWKEMNFQNYRYSFENITSGKIVANAEKNHIGIIDNIYTLE